jgi:acylaminoacyl-peptidase
MTRLAIRRLAFAALFLPGAWAPALALPPLSLEDVFSIEYASDPRIGPEGDRIVYVRNSMDPKTDRVRGELWTIATAGGRHRPLVTGLDSVSSPRWSPDGEKLAFVGVEDGETQIWVRWMDARQTAPVTRLPSKPDNLAWSPDGDWIAFTMRVPKETAPLAKMPKKPEGADWAEPVKVIDSLIYRADGQGFLEEGHTHVFVLPTDGGTPRQLTSGDFNHDGPISWLPNSRSLVISANRRDDWQLEPLDTDLWTVDLEDGEMRRLTDRYGPDASPAVSPDGRRIAYVGFDDERLGYHNAGLYLLDRDTREITLLTGELDRSVRDPVWDSRGRGIYFLYDDEGRTKLARIELSNGQVATIADDVGGVTLGRPYASGSFTVGAYGAVAYTQGAPDRPADVATGDGRRVRRLTRLNEDLLGFRELGKVEAFWFESAYDQRDVQGWIVLPPGFDPAKKYPLLLEIHGGPYQNYGPRFSAEMQLYAAAGYVVLYVNPRGSTSYGAEFANLIEDNYPGQDYDDLMSAVDAVLARGFVDPARMYVTGGSGGGVLTAWIVGKTDRFRAAAVAKPVINWASFALTADRYNFFYRYWFPGPPWEHPEEYWRRSPLSLVGNVDTPTMVLTGEQDWRTPMSESEQYYQALKLRGVDTLLVRVPGASHSIAARPTQLMAKVANILAWFERYPDPRPAPSPAVPPPGAEAPASPEPSVAPPAPEPEPASEPASGPDSATSSGGGPEG